MGVATAAGAKIYIGTTASVAATDTYTEIGEVANIPEFGRTYNVVNWSPLNSRGVQKLKGSYNEGDPAVQLGKDINDAGQAKVIVARDVDADYNFKVVANDDLPVDSFAVTISVATPGVFTKVAHGLVAGTQLTLSTSAADLPLGLTAGTIYVKEVLTADTFTVSATLGGAAIDTTDAGTGTHTVTTVPTGSTQYFKAQVMSYTTGYSGPDNVVTSTMVLGIKSGSLTEQVHLP